MAASDLLLELGAGFTDPPPWLLQLSFAVYAVLVTALVLLERRHPSSTLAWILGLVLVPVVGLLLYWVFGRRRVRKRRRRRDRRATRALDATQDAVRLDAVPFDLPPAQRELVQLALHTAAAPVRRSSDLQLLSTPDQCLAALRAAVMGARSHIHLEFYIWSDDAVTREFTTLLGEAAARGVKVRVLVDHVGSFGLPDDHFAGLRAVGGQVARFGRVRLAALLRAGGLRRGRADFRNHRKIGIVDGDLAFVGGPNMAAEYLSDPVGGAGRWRDLLVRLTGDATLGLEAIFLEDWAASTGEIVDLQGRRVWDPLAAATPSPGRRLLLRWRRHLREPRAAVELGASALAPRSEGRLVQILASGPDLPAPDAIVTQFTAALSMARVRAWIATPYFVPDESLAVVLRTAALRGVDVRLLLPAPERSDHRLVAWAGRSYYPELLDAGVRIFEYLPGMFHAKYVVIDETVAAVGSANMDIRSFYLNYEVTALLYDGSTVAALAAVFERDVLDAREVPPSGPRLGVLQRLGDGFARLLSPLM